MPRSLPLIISVFSILIIHICDAHARWKCPLPRDEKDEQGQHIKFENTGNKYGACGPESGKWGFGSVNVLTPGWTTFIWEESISHTGSPFRVALLDANETARIILLDHIPHNDFAKPVANIEKTYVEYKMSIQIPDVDCEKCSLQLLYVMTDKSVKCGVETCYYNPEDSACKGSTDPDKSTCPGAPNDQVCVQENECFSNYHSCSDVTIKGKNPLASFPFNGQPSDWPYAKMEMQHYTLEANEWKDGWLANIPSEFTTEYKLGC